MANDKSQMTDRKQRKGWTLHRDEGSANVRETALYDPRSKRKSRSKIRKRSRSTMKSKIRNHRYDSRRGL
jgi:hypothetical protein